MAAPAAPTRHAGDRWQLRKPAVTSRRGLVAAQHPEAARVGAEILARGGNAVDAAIATAFALGTTEPWMSGLGGGGIMLIYRADERQVHAVDYTMNAPKRLDPKRYPTVGGVDDGLFGWPVVEDERNQLGYESIAVPGAVAGFALARERFGSLSWGDLLAPAIALAERGMMIDWAASLSISVAARELHRFPSSAAVYLADGLPPVPPQFGSPRPLKLGALAETLKRLAKAGPDDFYQGEIARRLVGDLKAGGSRIAADDLADYRAELKAPLAVKYRGVDVALAPGLTAGPTAARVFADFERHAFGAPTPTPADFVAYARGFAAAYEHRLLALGHAAPGSCTTHLCTIDAAGNMVALTNTLLARFGSKVVLPETGVLMNNGIMWFDPRPGRPNSLAPGVKPLNNMCPLIATRDGRAWFAAGASGGRSIMPAVLQIASLVIDFGLSLDDAFHLPRIDLVRGATITCDAAMSDDAVAALSKAYPVEVREPTVYPTGWACPTAVERRPGGVNVAAADIRSPWASVAEQPA
ncbi:MAG TPA: gamma-glutamyltransferase [Candidatus Sulfotelmatobacter sp.]|nr:gamma-glutamyltransferase [Candidatus Sulfotelmatobacter sp.]